MELRTWPTPRTILQIPLPGSRRRRGFESEELLAQRWQDNGLFPDAVAGPRGSRGLDIRNTGMIIPEVKARGSVSLVAQLKRLDALRPGPFYIPTVYWRHNGQGPESMDYWTATTFLVDHEHMYRWGGDGK
jgi:hypothetical protein